MEDKDRFEIEKSEDGYRVKTAPLNWTEAHAQRERMIKAQKAQDEMRAAYYKKLKQILVWAGILVFIAFAIAFYFVGVNISF